jgi:hypothetical protein
MKLGIICIVLACFQASNGLARPKKAAPGEHDQFIRKIWMCLHQLSFHLFGVMLPYTDL